MVISSLWLAKPLETIPIPGVRAKGSIGCQDTQRHLRQQEETWSLCCLPTPAVDAKSASAALPCSLLLMLRLLLMLLLLLFWGGHSLLASSRS